MFLVAQKNTPTRGVAKSVSACFIAAILLCSTIAVAKQTRSRLLNIIAFGDSITAGLSRSAGIISCPAGVSLEPNRFGENGIGCYGNGVANIGGFEGLLKESIGQLGFDTTVYNWGFSGIKTADMIGQLQLVLDTQTNAQYVLILGGANDAFEVISASTVRFNTQRMIDQVRSRGMIPILGTPTPNTISRSLRFRIDDYSAQIRRLGQQNNVLVSDHNLIMSPEWETVPFHSGDKLHLGPIGNQQIAANWQNTLNLEPISLVPLNPIYLLLLED